MFVYAFVWFGDFVLFVCFKPKYVAIMMHVKKTETKQFTFSILCEYIAGQTMCFVRQIKNKIKRKKGKEDVKI